MTREEFDEIVKRSGAIVQSQNFWDGGDKDYIQVTWTLEKTRGIWNDPNVPEDEPDFEALDNILEIIRPDIRYLQYKKIMALTHKGTQDNSDYYSEIKEGYRRLYLDELYTALFPSYGDE